MEEIFRRYGAFIQSILDWWKELITNILGVIRPADKEDE